MNIDWSKAPEDATHVNRSGLFFNFDENLNARFYDGFWWRGNGFKLGDYDTMGELIERPNKQEAWDGEGLPPVGITCEVRYDDDNCWVVVDVYVHTEFKGDTYACAKNETDMFYGLANEFRPIKTAEQLAEEEKVTAIAEMRAVVIAASDRKRATIAECTATVALYEAGYRKQ